MKQSPDQQKLDEMLHASKFAAGGFMGHDQRPVDEILEADAATLARTGHARDEVASRMQEITALAVAGLGSWVKIDERREAMANDTRGVLPCPWPHPGVFRKTVTVLKDTASGDEIRWSMLCMHLVEAHGFFQGHGSAFRLDPAKLTAMIF